MSMQFPGAMSMGGEHFNTQMFLTRIIAFSFSDSKSSSTVSWNPYEPRYYSASRNTGFCINQITLTGFITTPKSSNTKKIFYKPAIPVFLFLIKTCLVFNTALYRLVLNCYNYTPEYVYNGNGAIRGK